MMRKFFRTAGSTALLEKTIVCTLALMTAVTSTSAGFAAAESGTTLYIKEIAVAGHDDGENAKRQLRENGFQVLDVDVNKGVSGSTDVFLGYKTTTNYREAITDLIISHGKSSTGDIVIDGKNFSMITCLNGFNGDLNHDAGGKYLFLKYTKDGKDKTASVLTNLAVEIRKTPDNRNSDYVKAYDGATVVDNPADLNRGAGGKDIFLKMIKTAYQGDNQILCSDFKAEHLGDRLYKFIIPVARVDGNNILNFLGSGASVGIVGTDSNVTGLFQITLPSGIDRSWITDDTHTVSLTAGLTGSAFVNPSNGFDLSQQLETPASGGNHTDFKSISVLWQAPEGFMGSQFQLKGDVYVDNGTSAGFSVQQTATSPKVSEDMNGIMVVEPFINTEASLPGYSKSLIVSANKMFSIGVYDATDNRFIHIEHSQDGVTQTEVSLQHDNREHNLVSVALGRTMIIGSDGKQDYGTELLTAPITQKAFHSILKARDVKPDEKDSSSFITGDTLRWYFENPDCEDLISQDEFIIERAFKSDLSDAELIGSLFFYDSTLVSIGGREYALYKFADNDPEGQFNRNAEDTQETSIFQTWENIPEAARNTLCTYSYPGHYTYYRVSRAFVRSLWYDDHRYETGWRSLNTNVLPVVSSISVHPSVSWETDRKVEVTVRLDNPYPWECVAPTDSNAVHKEAERQNFTRRMFMWNADARIIIQRYSSTSDWNPDGIDEVAKTISVAGSDVKWDDVSGTWNVTVTDLLSAPETNYYYSAVVDNSTTSWPICSTMNNKKTTSDDMAKNCRFSDLASVSNLVASRDEQGMIVLSWEADQGSVDRYEVKYRKYGSPDPWQNLATVSECMLKVTEQALPGTVYEFQVTSMAVFRGKEYRSAPVTAAGYNPYYGTIAGHVRLSNGAAMPGGMIQMEIRRDTPIHIDEVTDAATSALIMPGLHEETFVRQIPVGPDGSYRCDSIPYVGTGSSYSVRVSGLANVDFTNAAGNNGAITVDMTSGSYSHNAVDFVCSSLLRITGNILYSGSTVPVRDARFKANGVVMKDGSGNDILTDQSGYYSFFIPKGMPVSLQAFKEHHTLADGGYIIGSQDSPVTATDDNIGKVIYDSTTVRLVGRLTGGSRQAKIPMGMGIAKNNLGNDLLVELKLEGDNTANIVYDIKDPEKTERTATFTQSVTVAGKNQELMETKVNFERKRILIHPNDSTGEFCVDLFPAKYKITAMTAKGYSTLYAEGEGLQVIDLSDSIALNSHDNTLWVTDMMAKDVHGWDLKPRSTAYHASFLRVYHVPATVTLQQYDRLHRLKPYFGESNLTETNLQGTKVSAEVAWAKDAGTPEYAFGYPVFRSFNKYRLNISAHEDYYFNNDRTAAVDRVNLESGTVTLYNGYTNEPQRITAELDRNGTAELMFDVDNVCLNLTGTGALRTLSAEVEVNGYFYKSELVSGFVLGERDAGTEVMTLDSTIRIVDVIRDPYGKNSYAWRDKGTEYHWDRSFYQVESFEFKINGNIGGGNTTYVGIGLATKCEWTLTGGFNLNIPMRKNIESKSGEYTMTLNERIQTSSEELMQGAVADVYVGHVDVSHLREVKSFSLIDSVSHRQLSDAIRTGGVKVVKEGTTAAGKHFYLVVGPKLMVARDSVASTFAYSQKHITGTVIPQLEKRYSELVMAGASREEAEQMAQSTGMVRYYLDEAGLPQMAVPHDKYTGMNEALVIRNTISQWEEIIRTNEQAKYDAFRGIGGAPLKSYSIAGTPVEYTENANAYYSSYDFHTMGGHASGGFGISDNTTDNDGDQTKKKSQSQLKNNSLSVAGLVFSFSINPLQSSVSVSASQTYYKKSIAGAGFRMDITDQGYLDMDVYAQKDADLLVSEDNWDWLTSDMDNTNANDARNSDFIFIQRGGAVRAPWLDADTTIYYKEMGKSVPIGERCKKIDNPRIYIENPVVSNVPRDDKAIFSLRMVNETEYNGDAQSIIPIPFKLCMADNLNPSGVKITMDGAPITDGRKITLLPGESITKTIEVMRGNGYDFENIGLVLHDDTRTLNDTALFSVHFMPESSPVQLSAPSDKWILNTLSAHDDKGYYIPVEINGFDINYDGFDHIELQYKKHNDGESQWVNLCSFYTDKERMDAASGTRRLIDKNVISDIFYGEKDPMEMSYDLRAVSFCRLGTGFISRSSDISSGIKDTRTPEVFGKPTPANGILTPDYVITVPFNEPIAYNYLDRVANFSVTGFTNNSDANHSARLRFDGLGNEKAVTKVERSLSRSSFSVEMNVQLDKDEKGKPETAFFLTMEAQDVANIMIFGYMSYGDFLLAIMNGNVYTSESLEGRGINLSDAMTHIGLIHDITTDEVRFIAGNAVLKATAGSFAPSLLPSGSGSHKEGSPISVGTSMKGYISDVRIWQRALSDYEAANKYKKVLTSGEKDLMVWWPMDEAYGNVVKDKANGADLYLTDVTWETPDGYSVRLEDNSLVIHPDRMEFQTEDNQDYSLTFWFKADSLAVPSGLEQNGGLVTLFAAGADSLPDTGSGKMRIGFDSAGQLLLCSEGGVYDFGLGNDYATDGQWHHLAVVCNHSQNLSSLFIDGRLVNEFEADRLGRIAASPVSFGSKGFRGNMDEISLWHLALPKSYILDMMTTALNGREKELAVFLCFETDSLQNDNTMKTVFTALNNKVSETTGKVTGTLMFDSETVIHDRQSHAPVKANVGIQNLDFSWTASDNALQINILHKDAEINNQRIDFVLRGVEDLQGNPMKNPVMWSVYVDRNVLKWNNSSISTDVRYGEGATLVASWTNRSGRVINYTLDTGCRWLTIDRTMGTINPEGTENLVIQISDGLSPGTYNAVINLTDEDGLTSCLNLSVMVEASDPEWSVTTDNRFNQTMSLTGIVKQIQENGNAELDTDPRDMVAAFHEGICLGLANITVKEDNSAFVYLNIRGNNDIHKNILFYLWDKSKGEIVRLKSEAFTFKADSIVGSHSAPYVFTNDNVSIQSIGLKPGWNWVSFFLRPYDTQGVGNLFIDNSVFTPGDIIKGSLDNAYFAEYYGNGRWSNGAAKLAISPYHVYQIYVQKACNVKIEGYELPENERRVSIGARGWSQLPYLLKVVQPVNIALSDYPIDVKALPGTVIKSHDQFAVADKDRRWYGSLEYMRPGEGYYVNHLTDSTDILYTNTVLTDDKGKTTRSMTANSHSTSGEHEYAMPVIASLREEDYQDGDMLVARCAGREVGRAPAVSIGGRPLFFLMVNAEENNAIRFALERNGSTVEVTQNAIPFVSTAVVGSLEKPYLLNFSAADGDTELEVLDVNGMRFPENTDLRDSHIYIINGKKTIITK